MVGVDFDPNEACFYEQTAEEQQWDELATLRKEMRALKERLAALEQAQQVGKRDLLAGLSRAIQRSVEAGNGWEMPKDWKESAS